MEKEADDAHFKRRRLASVVAALAGCDDAEEGAARLVMEHAQALMMHKTALAACVLQIVQTPLPAPTTDTIVMLQQIPPAVTPPHFSNFIGLLQQEPHTFYTSFRMTKELFWHIVQVGRAHMKGGGSGLIACFRVLGLCSMVRCQGWCCPFADRAFCSRDAPPVAIATDGGRPS